MSLCSRFPRRRPTPSWTRRRTSQSGFEIATANRRPRLPRPRPTDVHISLRDGRWSVRHRTNGRTPLAGRASPPDVRFEPGRVAFLFTGQGGQAAGMGRRLRNTIPAFRSAWDRCDAAYRAITNESLDDITDFNDPYTCTRRQFRLRRQPYGNVGRVRRHADGRAGPQHRRVRGRSRGRHLHNRRGTANRRRPRPGG